MGRTHKTKAVVDRPSGMIGEIVSNLQFRAHMGWLAEAQVKRLDRVSQQDPTSYSRLSSAGFIDVSVAQGSVIFLFCTAFTAIFSGDRTGSGKNAVQTIPGIAYGAANAPNL
ncbi:hypothetical protein BDW69DRAFT_190726 [Aspergillus filifer]